MTDEKLSFQGRLDELDELSSETQRLIAASKKLMAEMEEKLEELRKQRLVTDALVEKRREQQRKKT